MAATPTCVQASIQFHVGGSLGWHEPSPNDSEFYSQWAERNRFQVGDALGKLVESLFFSECHAYSTILVWYVFD